ncbi:MAG TPA: tetratricopeptide repeat protein [Thermodesulfobacteriota bacterium]
MFFRRFWTILGIVLAVAAYVRLDTLNTAVVEFVYWPGRSVTASVTDLVAGAFAVGLVVALVIGFLREARRALRHLREARRSKRIEVSRDLYHQGLHHILLGNHDKARALLTQSLEKDPTKPNVYIRLADLAAQDDDFATAVQMLQRARLVDEQNLEARFKLAHYLRASGDVRGGAQVLEQVLELDATNRTALRELRELYVELKDWEKAHRVQRDLARLSQNDRSSAGQQAMLLGLKYELARSLMEQGQQERAEKLLREIVKADPSFRPGQVALGDLLYAQGDSEGAAEVWHGAFKQSGDVVFLARLEEMYLAEADPGKILALYRQAVAESPDDLRLRLFYGRLCLRLEMVEEALDALRYVEAAGVDTHDLHVLLAEAHRRRERFAESVEEFKRALNLGGRLEIPYVCGRCLAESPVWAARCPSCGSWDSLEMRGRAELELARTSVSALPSRVYHDI